MIIWPRRVMPVVALVWLLAACSSSVSRAELLGSYKANAATADSILLRGDGTYVHRYMSQNGVTISQEGTWVMEPPESDGVVRVTFDHFVLNFLPGSQQPSLWPAIVEKHFSTFDSSSTPIWGSST
jgi:hypothetical protein